MHRTDGANNVGGMFKDSPTPGTTVEHNWLTAIQEEVVQAILKSGQTLFTSGALDAAAAIPYQQLMKAITRLGSSYKDFVAVVTDGTGIDTTFNPDKLGYRLDVDPGGDTPGRRVLLPYNLTFGAQSYVFLVVNNTVSYKVLEDSVAHLSYPVLPGQALLMYGWENAGVLHWCPLNAESGLIRGQDDIHFAWPDTYSIDVTCNWSIRDGVISISLPNVNLHHADITVGLQYPTVNITLPAILAVGTGTMSTNIVLGVPAGGPGGGPKLVSQPASFNGVGGSFTADLGMVPTSGAHALYIAGQIISLPSAVYPAIYY